MEVFATQNVKISANALKSVRYQDGKSRLRPRVAGYLSYFASTDEPVILLADGLNLKVALDRLEASVALKFDGKISLEDIANELNVPNALKFVSQLENKLSKAYFLEEI